MSTVTANGTKATTSSNCQDKGQMADEEINASIGLCMAQLSGVNNFLAALRRTCMIHGAISTPMGRTNVIRGLNSRTQAAAHAKALRQAVSGYIQKSSRCLKIVMANIHTALIHMEEKGYKYYIKQDIGELGDGRVDSKALLCNHRMKPARQLRYERQTAEPFDGNVTVDRDVTLVMIVHDELIFEVRDSFIPAFSTLACNCFENSIVLEDHEGTESAIRLRARVKKGSTWAQLRKLTKITLFHIHTLVKFELHNRKNTNLFDLFDLLAQVKNLEHDCEHCEIHVVNSTW